MTTVVQIKTTKAHLIGKGELFSITSHDGSYLALALGSAGEDHAYAIAIAKGEESIAKILKVYFDEDCISFGDTWFALPDMKWSFDPNVGLPSTSHGVVATEGGLAFRCKADGLMSNPTYLLPSLDKTPSSSRTAVEALHFWVSRDSYIRGDDPFHTWKR